MDGDVHTRNPDNNRSESTLQTSWANALKKPLTWLRKHMNVQYLPYVCICPGCSFILKFTKELTPSTDMFKGNILLLQRSFFFSSRFNKMSHTPRYPNTKLRYFHCGTTGEKKNQFILQCVCKLLVTQSNPSIVVYVHLYFPDFLCNTLSPPQVEPPQSQQWCRLRGKCHLQVGEPSTTASLTVHLCLPCVSL